MGDKLERFKALCAKRPEGGIAGSTELLLDLMAPEEGRWLRLCAIPHEFDAEVVSALDGELSPQEAQKRVNELADLSVVIGTQEALAIHDEARAYLFKQWLGDEHRQEFETVSRRMVDYYSAKMEGADGAAAEIHSRNRMFHCLGTDQEEGFSEFERLLNKAHTEYRISECEGLIKLALEYDSVLEARYLAWLDFYRGRLEVQLRNWKQGWALLNHALKRADGQPDLRARATGWLGIIESEQRNWDDAIKLYERALEHAGEAQDAAGLSVTALDYLSVAYREKGDLKKAEELAHQAIRLATEADDWRGIARGSNSLGTICFKLGNVPAAVAAYQRALEALTVSRREFETAKVWNNLGNIYADNGDLELSEEAYYKSLAVQEQAGDSLGQALVLNNLSRLLQRRNAFEPALETQKKALRLLERLHTRYRLAVAKWNLGRLHKRLGDLEAAERCMTEAEELFRNHGELGKANAIAEERESLHRKTPLPWWAIALIVLVVLGVVAFVVSMVADL